MNVDVHTLQGTAEELLQQLEAAQASDKEAERQVSKFGWLAFFSFLVAVIGIPVAFGVPPVGWVLILAGVVAGVVFLFKRSGHNAFDLNDRKLATAVQFLKIIRADTPPTAPLRLRIDFRDYLKGGRLISDDVQDPGFFGSDIKVKKYEHPWFEVSGVLEDGTHYELTALERVGRKEKPKRKYTKVKERVSGLLTAKLKLKDERYGAAEQVAQILGKLAPPTGMAPRAIKGQGKNLQVSVCTDGQVQVHGRYDTYVQAVGHEVTGNSLLTLLLWVYDAIGRSAAHRSAA